MVCLAESYAKMRLQFETGAGSICPHRESYQCLSSQFCMVTVSPCIFVANIVVHGTWCASKSFQWITFVRVVPVAMSIEIGIVVDTVSCVSIVKLGNAVGMASLDTIKLFVGEVWLAVLSKVYVMACFFSSLYRKAVFIDSNGQGG